MAGVFVHEPPFCALHTHQVLAVETNHILSHQTAQTAAAILPFKQFSRLKVFEPPDPFQGQPSESPHPFGSLPVPPAVRFPSLVLSRALLLSDLPVLIAPLSG